MTEVKIVPKGGVLQFVHDGSPEAEQIAEYVCGLVKEAHRIGKSRDALVAKAALGDAVLKQRELMIEKMEVLAEIAKSAEAKAIDTSLTWEMRRLHESRASAAKDEIRKLAAELGE